MGNRSLKRYGQGGDAEVGNDRQTQLAPGKRTAVAARYGTYTQLAASAKKQSPAQATQTTQATQTAQATQTNESAGVAPSAQGPHPLYEAGKQLVELIGANIDKTPSAAANHDSSTTSHGQSAASNDKSTSLRPKHAAAWKSYDVPIDGELLATPDPSYELTLCMLQVGLAEFGQAPSRFDLEQLYFLVPWDTLPSQDAVQREVMAALESGRDAIGYRSNAVGLALQAREQQQFKLRRAHAEFQQRLKDSTFVQDAILSFYIAHLNAPVGLINDGIALAWKGTDFVGVTDSEPPTVPKLGYVGEFGQRYGEAMEMGAKTGLLIVATGPLSSALANASARASSLAGTIAVGGVQVGTLTLSAARLSMTLGAIVELGELSGYLAGLIFTAAAGDDEERAQALKGLRETVLLGAFEFILGRHSKATAGHHSGSGHARGNGNNHVPEQPQQRGHLEPHQQNPNREGADYYHEKTQETPRQEPTSTHPDTIIVRVGPDADVDHAAKGGLGTNANFAQKTFAAMFSKGGKFAGQSVDDVADGLRSGVLKTSDVPIDFIVRDGQTLILNTRSAHALQAAGVPRSAWSTVNRTGQDLFENMLSGQLKRNKLTNAGIGTVRRTGR